MSRRVRLGGECGQTAAEFLGLILVVAAIVGVIAASDIDGQIAAGVSDEVCRVLKDDGDCAKTKPAERAEAPDADGDGLSDREERRRGTLPDKADSDSDGLFDGDEIDRGTDPLASDSDGDGLSDGREVRSAPGGGDFFDPLKADQDGDGLNDAQELAAGTPPGDDDGDQGDGGGLTDGLTDREEILRHGTDPTVIDTDGDGGSDGDEVAEDTNPLVDERSLGQKVAPIGEDLLLGDLPTPAAVGTLLKKLPGVGKALKKLFGSRDEAAKLFKKNAEEAVERRRKVDQAAPDASPAPQKGDGPRRRLDLRSETGAVGPGAGDLAALQKFARRVRLPQDNPAVVHRDLPVDVFVGRFRRGSVRSELPGQFLNQTVEQALRSGDPTVRKLLTRGEYAK